MANRDMKLNILVSLKDRISNSLGRLTSNLERMGAVMRKIGAVGAIIGGISFMAPLNEAAAFQQQLIDIAGTAELTGAKAFKFVDEAKTKYETLALGIGQTSETVAAGAGKMIAAGLDLADVEASLKDIGIAATAANASFDDMAGVATSMMQNLKVPASEVRDSLGALVAAGKLGSFELKDMAREFPNLTSQVSKFGVTGREAVNFLGAGLQVAMKGAADTSIAANNFSNFLSKALAPKTIKNFKSMGVDIEKVMKDAATKGINPLEAVLAKVRDITGVSQKEIDGYMKKAKQNGLEGAQAFEYVRGELEKIGAAGKISELFGDQQVLDFVVPALANADTFKSIKEQVSKATGAMTDADFETQMQGLNVQKRILTEIGTQFSREWGLAFGTWLPIINQGLSFLLSKFREIDNASGGWLKKALGLGAGAVLLATGIGALGLALPLVTAGFGALATIIGAVFSPLGLIIGLIAGAGVLIWQNWDKVKPTLLAFWKTITDAASYAWDSIKSAWQYASPYFESFWLKLKDMSSTAWTWISNNAVKAWTGIKSAWSKASPYLTSMWNRLKREGGNAWTWISDKAGIAWKSIKEKTKGAFSDINWDNARNKMLGYYEKALNGLGHAFEFLRDVWTGFEPSLTKMGENLKSAFGSLGGTWENIKGIASGLGELAANLLKFAGIDIDSNEGAGKTIGKILGFIGEFATGGIKVAADILQIITGSIRALIDLLNGNTPDWRSYFPDWLVEMVDHIGNGITTIKNGLEWISGHKESEKTVTEGLPTLDEIQERQRAEREAAEKPVYMADLIEKNKTADKNTSIIPPPKTITLGLDLRHEDESILGKKQIDEALNKRAVRTNLSNTYFSQSETKLEPVPQPKKIDIDNKLDGITKTQVPLPQVQNNAVPVRKLDLGGKITGVNDNFSPQALERPNSNFIKTGNDAIIQAPVPSSKSTELGNKINDAINVSGQKDSKITFAPLPPVNVELGKQTIDVDVKVHGDATATAKVIQSQAPSVTSDGGRAVGRN